MTLTAYCADEFSLMIQLQLQVRNICYNCHLALHLLIQIV